MASLRVTLSIHKESDNGMVFCKMDGERFSKAKTVKLLTDSKYRIDIIFRPAKKLVGITMMDRSLIAVEKLQEETESTCYSAHFHTDNLKPSKKGNRENIQLVLKMLGGYEFSTHLQIKWYKSTNIQHCEWGNSIHSIEYECTIDSQSNGVKIVKETFR